MRKGTWREAREWYGWLRRSRSQKAKEIREVMAQYGNVEAVVPPPLPAVIDAAYVLAIDRKIKPKLVAQVVRACVPIEPSHYADDAHALAQTVKLIIESCRDDTCYVTREEMPKAVTAQRLEELGAQDHKTVPFLDYRNRKSRQRGGEITRCPKD